MSDSTVTSRRSFLGKSLAVLAAGSAVAACGKKEPSGPKALACNDTSSLEAADAQMRTTLGYVDASVQEGKSCSNCQLYKPAPADGQCGGCNVLKGTINPMGYCNSCTAKA
jgi:hypothetical protein